MASIFLSQQNGDCKIVLLAQLQRSVKKLLCVCEARDGCVMRYTEENCALKVEKNKYILQQWVANFSLFYKIRALKPR